MIKQLYAPLYSLFFCIALPAQAGLFSDEDARKQIQQLEARVELLDNTAKQQIQSLLDFQEQIDLLNTETRKLRGRNEELAHGLQDAEKRAKDFYVDLDTRIRHLDATVAAVRAIAEAAANSAAASPVEEEVAVEEPYDPVKENRAFEAAYLFLGEGQYAEAAAAFQEFIGKYPDSAHIANAKFWLGNAQFGANDYTGALTTFQEVLKLSPSDTRAADVLFNIAGCQQGIDQVDAAIQTLEQLISEYPNSKAAKKAKKLLTPAKPAANVIRQTQKPNTGTAQQSGNIENK